MLDWRKELRCRLAGSGLGAEAESDLIEELSQHLEQDYRGLLSRGTSPADAIVQLRGQLDDPQLREGAAIRSAASRASLALGDNSSARSIVDGVMRDLSHGWRSIKRSPVTSGIIVASLALAIGANTAIFGLLHALYLRRLPFPHPTELVGLAPVNHRAQAVMRYGDLPVFRTSVGVPRLEGFRFEPATVEARGEPADFWVDAVGGQFFNLLGAAPALGRTIVPSDEQTAAPVAVVSNDYWTKYLGASRNAIGEVIKIDGAPFTVVGVMPRGFNGVHFARSYSVAIPLSLTMGKRTPLSYAVYMIARIAPRDRQHAANAMSLAYQRCCGENTFGPISAASANHPTIFPENPPYGVSTVPQDLIADSTAGVIIRDASHGLTWNIDYRAQYRRVLVGTMVGVFILLLIACANIATLLLARADARSREFAVRLSLGAGRGRLIRQTLTESIQLAAMGTGLGVVLATLGTRFLIHNLPSSALLLADELPTRPNLAILGFSVCAAICCTLLFGIWPARHAGQTDILSSLTGARRWFTRVNGWTTDRMLVAAQVALALVLICSAALLVATFNNLTTSEGGYRTTHALVVQVFPVQRNDSTTIDLERIRQTALQVPGATNAAFAMSVPVYQDALMMAQLHVRDAGGSATDTIRSRLNIVSANFLSISGIGVARGRDFSPLDSRDTERVAIVSEAFQRHYFPAGDAVGQVIDVMGVGPIRQRRIVGVAHDARYDRAAGSTVDMRTAETEMVYICLGQMANAPRALTLVVSTAPDPSAIAPSLLRSITGVSPNIRLARLATVRGLLNDASVNERFAAALSTVFGIIALALTMIGVFGLLSYNVSRRTHEVGVRMALGATERDTLWLVLRQGMTVASAGIAVGVPLALVVAHMVKAQLYAISSANLAVPLGGALLLAFIAVAASVVPARRAMQVDPMIALRAE